MPQLTVTNSPKQLDWSGCPIIWRVPGLMGGVPVIRGMRITPEAILMHWEDGMNFAEIAQIFGGVSTHDMKTIVDYAQAHNLSTMDGD